MGIFGSFAQQLRQATTTSVLTVYLSIFRQGKTGKICVEIDIVGFTASRHKYILFRIGQEKYPVNKYLPKISDQFGY
jgi:hypothetical protein